MYWVDIEHGQPFVSAHWNHCFYIPSAFAIVCGSSILWFLTYFEEYCIVMYCKHFKYCRIYCIMCKVFSLAISNLFFYRYVIQPSSMFAIPTRLNRWKQGKRPWPHTLNRAGSETDINKSLSSAFSRDRTHSLESQDNVKKFRLGSLK